MKKKIITLMLLSFLSIATISAASAQDRDRRHHPRHGRSHGHGHDHGRDHGHDRDRH